MGDWDVVEKKPIGPWDVVESIPEGGDWPVDTRTGQQVQTSAENIQQSKEAMGSYKEFGAEALPIAGDIALTAAMPQISVAKNLPRLAQLGVKGVNLLARGVGSAAGSAGGELGRQEILGEDDPERITDQAKLGFGGEVGTSLAMGALKPLAKPFLNMMSDITVAGAGIKKAVRSRIITKTTKQAEDFINDIAPDVVKQAGTKIDIDDLGAAVNEAFDETKVVYNMYNDTLKSMARKNGEVLVDDTGQWLGEMYEKIHIKGPAKKEGFKVNSVIREFGWTPASPEGRTLKNLIEGGGETTPENVQYLLAGMFKKGKKNIWDDLNPKQRANREKLKELIIGDIAKQSPDAGLLKIKADEAFKQIVRYNKIRKIYEGAIREMPSGDKYLNPAKLSKDIYKNKKKIVQEMPEVWPQLKKEAEYYAKMAPNFRPPEKTALSSVPTKLIGSSGATYAMGGWGIPVAESFGAFSAWAYLSPKVRKTLGVMIKSTAKATIHGAGMPPMPAHTPRGGATGSW